MEVCVDFSAQGWLMEERRRGRGAAGETTSSKRGRGQTLHKIKKVLVQGELFDGSRHEKSGLVGKVL